MSILDRFKKKEEKKNFEARAVKAAPKAAPKTVREEREAAEMKKTDKKAVAASVTATGGTYGHAVLLKPIVSEKSALLHASNQYIFMVAPTANKVSVKKAIKETYNAEPTEIRIIKMSGKKVTRGRTTGHTKSYKKAIVRMPKGVSLPIYEGV